MTALAESPPRRRCDQCLRGVEGCDGDASAGDESLEILRSRRPLTRLKRKAARNFYNSVESRFHFWVDSSFYY